MGDCHILTDNIRGAQKNGVAESVCGVKSLLLCHNAHSLGAADCEFFKQSVKAFSVLCGVNSVCGGSEDFYTVFIKIFCELYGSLTAECNNNAERLFNLDDVHNILGCQRLKIEPVRRVIVC